MTVSRPLSKVHEEHLLIAQTFDDTFTGHEFRSRYLQLFPSRNPGSIIPGDYKADCGAHRKPGNPTFLEEVGPLVYRYIGLQGQLTAAAAILQANFAGDIFNFTVDALCFEILPPDVSKAAATRHS